VVNLQHLLCLLFITVVSGRFEHFQQITLNVGQRESGPACQKISCYVYKHYFQFMPHFYKAGPHAPSLNAAIVVVVVVAFFCSLIGSHHGVLP